MTTVTVGALSFTVTVGTDAVEVDATTQPQTLDVDDTSVTVVTFLADSSVEIGP